MFINFSLNLFLLLLCMPRVLARQNPSAAHPGDKIYLDVIVAPKTGAPVNGLQQQDFTILDNNVPQTIASFEAVDGRQANIEVVLVLDAVNIGSHREAALEREEISRFLKADGGRLTYPTTVAILTAKGLQFQEDFSQDGNAISTALGKHAMAIRSSNDTTDRDRFQISFQGFAKLLARERDRPGRKIILWMSPGWPPPFGLDQRDRKLEQRQELAMQVFGNVVEISTQLREAQITLYSVDPSALGDIDPGLTDPPSIHLRPSERAFYIEGASRPSGVRETDLALEVLATQNGGLALHPGNDLASELRKCLDDTTAFYEISFEPAITDRPNEYHHLEIRVAKPGLTARTRQGYYSQPWPAEKFEAESRKLGRADDTPSPREGTESAAPEDVGDRSYYASANPYIDQPLGQLIERVPELKTLQPAPDQHELPVILQNVGRSVDDFVRNIGDLIAREEVTQERLNAEGKVKAKSRVQDDYLILHHGYEWGASAEYRMDKNGNHLGPVGLEKGYLVTSGIALSCISFSTVAQAQSKFLYLGGEMIGSRETYVLGFAQQPGEATFTTTMRGTGGAHVTDMLTQGILWVDKNSFQIIRMRTDLLAPNNEIRLDQLTTEVTFGEVRLPDVPSALWLPSDVEVYMEIDKQKYRNLHHYTDYRRYRVAAKIGAPH
jgi:VWFA-related protein